MSRAEDIGWRVLFAVSAVLLLVANAAARPWLTLAALAWALAMIGLGFRRLFELDEQRRRGDRR